MTEDIQIGGTADEKLQSQLYIGKLQCTWHITIVFRLIDLYKM